MNKLQQRIERHQQSFSTKAECTLENARNYLGNVHNELEYAYHEGADIILLINTRSSALDFLLQQIWQHHLCAPLQSLSLIAVGGYGRGEMHPYSDIDLLILLEREPGEACRQSISDFMTFLWDLKLEIGHSVRPLEECLDIARNDLTIITNLIESRWLCGDEQLFQQLQEGITPDQMWNSQQFFKAKLGEQKYRYRRFGDTAYRVEPNLKDGPGGLRDLQMISWVTARNYGTLSLEELRDEHLLSESEYRQLIECRNFLWTVRFALHMEADRKEDRLRLEHQQNLAGHFGYTSNHATEAVEQFMQRYYRTITRLERLTELLIGIFREKILPSEDHQITRINAWCEKRDAYLAVTRPDIFTLKPHTLLEIFYLLQTISGTRGLVPSSIRLINAHLPMIDEDYRSQPEHKKIFMKIMSESHGITYVLRRMNRYGILAAWIPVFANIVGRMQFDLFHAYTVDDHILRVIRNLRRHSTDEGQQELPFATMIFNTIPNPTLLYLAGLFHDIAKGRGGDHSELGAADAFEFCRSHQLNSFDSHLVSWLVRHHLLMSMTAQQKDTSDPEVINEFAAQVVSSTRLDYLYLLTIADMRGTNPDIWNSWKASLLQDLYIRARNLLKHGIAPANYQQLLEQKTQAILEQFPIGPLTKADARRYCHDMGSEYMLQHSVNTIIWQMSSILHENVYPLVQIRQETNLNSTLLFVYTPDTEALFAKTTRVLEQLNVNTVAAYIMRTPKGFLLETFNILSRNNRLIEDEDEQRFLINRLRSKIPRPFDDTESILADSRLEVFQTKTRVSFKQDEERQLTIITIRTLDKPGLLSRISQILYTLGLHILSARIATLGEEAEDLFYLTDSNHKPIAGEARMENIRQSIIKQLDKPAPE